VPRCHSPTTSVRKCESGDETREGGLVHSELRVLEVQIEATAATVSPHNCPRACRRRGRICLCATAQRNGRRRHWPGLADQKARAQTDGLARRSYLDTEICQSQGMQQEGQVRLAAFSCPSGIVKPASFETNRPDGQGRRNASSSNSFHCLPPAVVILEMQLFSLSLLSTAVPDSGPKTGPNAQLHLLFGEDSGPLGARA
jgi:hypothetical protein